MLRISTQGFLSAAALQVFRSPATSRSSGLRCFYGSRSSCGNRGVILPFGSSVVKLDVTGVAASSIRLAIISSASSLSLTFVLILLSRINARSSELNCAVAISKAENSITYLRTALLWSSSNVNFTPAPRRSSSSPPRGRSPCTGSGTSRTANSGWVRSHRAVR